MTTGLPNGYDPDRFIREHGADAIRALCYTGEPPPVLPPLRRIRSRATRRCREVVTPEEQDRRMAAMLDNLERLDLQSLTRRWPYGGGGQGPIDYAEIEAREAREEARRVEAERRRACGAAFMIALRARCRLLVWSAAHPGQPPPSQRREAPVIDRASRYLAILPPSVSGSGGHDALWEAVIHTLHGFSLGEAETLGLLMREFSPRCSPPWQRHEVAAKIRSARGAKCGRGWHLERRRA